MNQQHEGATSVKLHFFSARDSRKYSFGGWSMGVT
jgi:hypothetical protein